MSEIAQPHLAHLDAPAVAKLEAVEKSLGDVYVLAYDKPMTPAKLSSEQLKLLQQAERDLGVCLVAYQAQ
jgi:hypothetical protein